MLSVVRRSQVVGEIDSSTLTLPGKIEEVWLDAAHQVAYLSSCSGFVPLGQVAALDYHLLSTYGRLLVKPSSPLTAPVSTGHTVSSGRMVRVGGGFSL